MSKLIILHLMNGFKNASIGQIVKQLVAGLGNQNYEWHIGGLSGLGEMQDEYRQLGAEVIDFSDIGPGDVSSTQKIRQYICQNRVQIIHSHTPRTILTAWLALTRLHRSPHMRTFHIATKHSFIQPNDRKWGTLVSAADRLSLYLPDLIVPVSYTMAKKVQALPGIREERINAVPNAITCEKWHIPEKRQNIRSELGLAADRIAVGFGGRIEQVKRLDLLLQAFAGVYQIHPDTCLILAGEGSLRPTLEQLALQLGISQAIIWMGFCNDMPGFLSALDIYVQSSVNEGLSLSILEAMAAEKPVIATRVGAAEEVLEDEVNGILIPPYSSKAIQTALLDMIEHPDKAKRIAIEAHKHVLKKYDVIRMVNGYDQLYHQLTILQSQRMSAPKQSPFDFS